MSTYSFNLNKKTLIIAASNLPPSITGPGIIMGRILKYFPKNSYCILTKSFSSDEQRIDPTTILDCSYYLVNIPGENLSFSNTGVGRIVFKTLFIFFSFYKGLKIIYKENINSILVLSGTGDFEIGGLFLHKVTNKPLFVYIFDMYYTPQSINRLNKFVARITEGPLFNNAKSVFVMSEPLKKHYSLKYGISPILLPHPVDISKYKNKGKLLSKSNNHIKIVFTGMIYAAQIDALLNLVKTLDIFPELNAKLYLYTPRTSGALKKMGLLSKNIVYGFVSPGEIPDIQMSADILFLPMSFSSPYPDIIKTASPSKIGEYLAAGRPILVHAPSDSYVSRYAKQQGFGFVVDKPDPGLLKEAILRLFDNQDLKNRLIENAHRTSKNHDVRHVFKKLQNYFFSETLGMGSYN